MALAVGGAVLVAVAQPIGGALREVMARGLHFDASAVGRPHAMFERLGELSWWLIAICIPMGILMVALSLLSGVISGGWNFTLKPLFPKFSKLNPLAGLGRMVSPSQMGDMLKSCVLALVLGAVGALYLKDHWGEFQRLALMNLGVALPILGSLLTSALALLVLGLAAFAVLDVPFQRFLMAKRLKMSHQEAKQEHKELEGNGEIKGRMKARMREIAKRRMMSAVPSADLIVMNPSHYAVAIRYDETSMGAPRVVAKGADLLAFRIRDLAKMHQVPVLRMPPLARALYAHVEIDQEIPAALFSAVAQVLAYVYQLRAALAVGAPTPSEPTDVNVPDELDPLNQRAADAEVAPA